MKIRLANQLPETTEANTIYIVPDGTDKIALHVAGKDNIVRSSLSLADVPAQSTNKAQQFFLASS